MDSGEERKGGTGASDKESPEKVYFHCLDTLPEEMWRELLGKLDDVPTLLNFRSVSPDLKILSEEKLTDLASRRFENRPYYGFVEGEVYFSSASAKNVRHWDERLFMLCGFEEIHIKATTPEQVKTIIASKDTDIVGSHIPTGCVVFYPDKKLVNLLPFYNCLEPLVNTFLEDITSLVYQPHHTLDSMQFNMQLSLIFKLKNLRQLLIYYSHIPNCPPKFELDTLNKVFQGSTKMHVNTGLKNLHLREYPPNKVGTLPLITVFKNILPDCNDLEHLNFNWNPNIDMRQITEQMLRHPPPPKLKHLVLQDPSLQLLEYFCLNSNNAGHAKNPPSLKTLSIRFNKEGFNGFSIISPYSREESTIIQLFKTLDFNHTHLEMLTLDLYLPSEFSRQNCPLDLSVKYLKVTTLGINYTTLLRYGSLLEVLSEKIPNVETVLVECGYEGMKLIEPGGSKVAGVYILACSLWKVFPSLKTIKISYLNWELTRDGGQVPDNVMQVARRVLL